MPRLSKAEKERCHREILEMEQAKIKPYLDRIAELEKQKEKECVLKALKKYPNFEENNGYIWKDGRNTIYIIIA